MAGMIGGKPRVEPTTDTVWFENPRDWDQVLEEAKFDPDNEWWNLAKAATKIAVEMSDSKYGVSVTDLGTNLDVAAPLRGTHNLLTDLYDHPGKVKTLLDRIDQLWVRYYNELNHMIQSRMEGTYLRWYQWAPGDFYTPGCDFAAMISPKMFEKFAAPSLATLAQRLDHTIYHWDSPGQIPHLEILLDIPGVDGFQWVPGEGNPGCASPKWFPLYERIQKRGKLLMLDVCNAAELERLLEKLSLRGLAIWMTCESEDEARYVVDNAPRWSRVR